MSNKIRSQQNQTLVSQIEREAICYLQKGSPRGQAILWGGTEAAKKHRQRDLLPLYLTRIISSPLPLSHGPENLMKILGGN